jgi:excisionase family DNA binding protein
MPASLLCPIPEACAEIGIGRSKLYQLIQAGEIEAIRLGKRRLVVRESLIAFIERLRAAAVA